MDATPELSPLPSMIDSNLDFKAIAVCYRILAGIITVATVVPVASLFGNTVSWLPQIFSTFVGSLMRLALALATPWPRLGVCLLVACILFETGSALKERRSRTFTLIVAWLTSGFFPLGTVLGAVTIWKLFARNQ